MIPLAMKKSTHSCSVFRCSTGVQLITYRFPNPKTQLQRFLEWLEAIANPRYVVLRNDQIYGRCYVCVKHFTPDDFIADRVYKLKSNAVPSLHLPEPLQRTGPPKIDADAVDKSLVTFDLDFTSYEQEYSSIFSADAVDKSLDNIDMNLARPEKENSSILEMILCSPRQRVTPKIVGKVTEGQEKQVQSVNEVPITASVSIDKRPFMITESTRHTVFEQTPPEKNSPRLSGFLVATSNHTTKKIIEEIGLSHSEVTPAVLQTIRYFQSQEKNQKMKERKHLRNIQRLKQNVNICKEKLKTAKQPTQLLNMIKSDSLRNLVEIDLQSQKKSLKGMRYSEEQKMLGLALMKRCARSYKLLRSQFQLPTRNTIMRDLAKIQLKPDENDCIIQAIETQAAICEDPNNIPIEIQVIEV